jgi:hypothetical protein
LRGHKYGIRNLELNGELLVSIGDENDKGMLVWDLGSGNMEIVSANLMKKAYANSVAFLPLGDDIDKSSKLH